MAEFPALPLFTDAYLGDTTHLTTIEHGAYLLLLIVSWRTRECRLPDDDKLLARYARMTSAQWARMRPTLEPFFTIEDGFWSQKRLIDEHDHVRQVRERQIENGRASALKRKGRHSTKRQRGVNEASTPSPSPTIVEETNVSSPNRALPNSDILLPDVIPKDAWDAYSAMRKKQRKPMTERAAQMVIAKLVAFADAGQPPGEILDQSTVNCWTDVYELKGQRNGTGQSTGSLRGTRPDPSLDLWRQANAELEAERRDQGDNRGTRSSLPAVRPN